MSGGISHRGAHARRFFLGLMAGTSGDGIDAVCLRVAGGGLAMRAAVELHIHREFRPSLRRRLLAVMAPAATRTEELARLHSDLGDAFAAAARAAIMELGPRRRPSAVGLAGQTVCHLPSGKSGKTVTLQLGEPARVAAAAGVPVVAEFRQSDVAAGGQGAPLVPWTDWVLLRSQRVSRAVQNIGGIGNVTWLPAGGRPRDVIAFDTGPGNMVIDGLVAHLSGGRERMDRDGRRALRGRVLETVLDRWLANPFFRQRPPRTTGRELFGRPFIEAELPRLRRASNNGDDWVATATALTARSIAAAYRRWLPGFIGGKAGAGKRIEVILCGGGAENPALFSMLSAELPGIRIQKIDCLGIGSQAKEAASFALLAAARLDGVPSNLPQVTGARRATVLGAIVCP